MMPPTTRHENPKFFFKGVDRLDKLDFQDKTLSCTTPLKKNLGFLLADLVKSDSVRPGASGGSNYLTLHKATSQDNFQRPRLLAEGLAAVSCEALSWPLHP